MREIDNIMVSASKVLGEMTQHTTVSMISHTGGRQVKKCELIDVDGGFTYAVVLVTDSEVKNKMLRLSQPVEPATAAVLSTAINLALSERRLEYLLPSVQQSMGGSSAVYQMTSDILDFIRATEAGGKSEVYIDGAARLLDNREYQDAHRARELLEYVSDRSRVGELLEREEAGGLVKIRIGPELQDPSMRDASLVFTSYEIDKNTRGIVGIIAPARMDYADVCAKLIAFTQAVSGVTGQGLKRLKDAGESDERRD